MAEEGPPESIKYDYVLVFDDPSSSIFGPKKKQNAAQVAPQETVDEEVVKVKEKRAEIIEKLKSIGLTVEVKPGVEDEEQTFVLLSAPEELQLKHAEEMELEMQLKPEHGGAWDVFKRETKEMFVPAGKKNFFRASVRQQILLSLIESEPYEGGADVNLGLETEAGIVTKFFPAHTAARRNLMTNWAKGFFKKQPLLEIRNYFGESIGFYFAFLGNYCTWLGVASLVGVVAFIVSFFEKHNWAGSAYSIFLALWATVFLNYWMRKNAVLVFRWHMEEFDNTEDARPSFRGEDKLGVVHEDVWVPWETEKYGIKPKMSKFYPVNKRTMKKAVSFVPITTLAMAVVIATVAILTFRLFLQRSSFSTLGGLIGGVANAIAILVLNAVYRKAAVILNNWENHRTQTKYDDHLIVKIFLFQFVNSYTSLFYVAFFKNHARLFSDKFVDACNIGPSQPGSLGCKSELTMQLATILGTNIVVGQLQEVVLPWLINKIRRSILTRCSGKQNLKLPVWEEEAHMLPYAGNLDEYSELVIQFGYITLFAAAFPLAPLMALVNNLIEIRTDAVKLLMQTNRPDYRGADGIGVWYIILEILGVIGVITNCLMIAFTHQTLYYLVGSMLWSFAISVLLEHVLIVLKIALSIFISDVPEYIQNEYARLSYMKMEALKNLKIEKLKKTVNLLVPTSMSSNSGLGVGHLSVKLPSERQMFLSQVIAGGHDPTTPPQANTELPPQQANPNSSSELVVEDDS